MTSLDELVDDLVQTGEVTAAAAVLQSGAGTARVSYAGWQEVVERRRAVGPETRFDLASLTKPFTATLALRLDQAGTLPLETALGSVWPEVVGELADTKLEDLLRHRAHLRRWMPLYAICRGPEEVAQRLLDGEWLDAPLETYSDLDFILWGLSAERALGRTFGDLMQDLVLSPLGSEALDLTGEQRSCAQCVLPTGREVELASAIGLTIEELSPPQPGQPQDGNTRFFRRPIGHAGLFATAPELLALAQEYRHPHSLLTRESVVRAVGGDGEYGLGWFRSSQARAGGAFGPGAFGHEGFVGGSLWLDPEKGVIAILLTHRASLDVDLTEARVRLHRLAGRL